MNGLSLIQQNGDIDHSGKNEPDVNLIMLTLCSVLFCYNDGCRASEKAPMLLLFS